MGATVVDGSVEPANWTKKKPKDYKGTALDSALAALTKTQAKNVTIPASLPALPKQSAKEFDKCVKEMESAVKDLKTASSYLKDLAKAFDTVSSAGKSTATELKKLANDKDKDEKRAYLDASSTASAIALQAGTASSQIQ